MGRRNGFGPILIMVIGLSAAGGVILGAGAAQAAIPAAERQALIDLYNSTNGAGWTNNAGWLGVAGTECSWHGVTCNVGDTTVTRVWLPANNLVGTIPPTLGNLANLQQLYVQTNQLVGTIPPELGTLAKLEGLGLWLNQLSGAIPPELGNLGSLQVLDLDSNQLSGAIPSTLGNLGSLQQLLLEHNQLTGIPLELGNLGLLDQLDLTDNQLTGPIPGELGNLANLEFLNLNKNHLSGAIPPELGSLTKLRSLDLEHNQLSGPIPEELGNLLTLDDLWLNANQLNGTIPAALGNMVALASLRLGNNQLSGAIPKELGGLSALRELSLHRNQLSGSIPLELGNLTSLQTLSLRGNSIVGEIPATLAALTNLQANQLDLRWNGLWTWDATLASFLNTKQVGGDWQGTQTVPPVDLAHGSMTKTSINLTWTPITYAGDTGGYQVYMTTTPGGPYALALTTPSKSDSTADVTGLQPATIYYFVVRTVTEPHASNDNTVVSDPTPVVPAATEAFPLVIATTSPLPNGAVGVAYTATFAATGGRIPYTWGLWSGSLPPGLTLSSAGVLSGTPGASGDFTFSVVVYDSADESTNKELDLAIGTPEPIPTLGHGGMAAFLVLLVAFAVLVIRRRLS